MSYSNRFYAFVRQLREKGSYWIERGCQDDTEGISYVSEGFSVEWNGDLLEGERRTMEEGCISEKSLVERIAIDYLVEKGLDQIDSSRKIIES